MLGMLPRRTGSDSAEDTCVTKEEAETEVDALELNLSGFGGLVFCLSGDGGQISFGESVGVPLWLEYPLEGDKVLSNLLSAVKPFCWSELLVSHWSTMEGWSWLGLRGLEMLDAWESSVTVLELEE